LATGLAALLAVGQSAALSLVYAAIAMIGFHLVYGFEALGRPRAFTSDDERVRKVERALAEAEGKLLELDRAARRIGNPELKSRLGRIGAQGRAILDQIAGRPTDLSRARRFLAVYLDGVKQVTDGYARTHTQADSRDLEQNFRNVLVTVERVFDEQHQHLLETDLMDLDIQIEVLQKQLEREGIR
jgi:5-bromo-4-chloroindolyl phosphate hydrolysis protein